jgi:hypothetical protein
MKCINRCEDPAEQNFTWPTSRGPMSINLCGVCASDFWNKFNSTEAGLCIIVSSPKNVRELSLVCSEYGIEQAV